jgi:hypothetical protein
MGHYARQCPKKKKKKHQDDTIAKTEELEFDTQFVRECAFVSSLAFVTSSSVRWGKKLRKAY